MADRQVQLFTGSLVATADRFESPVLPFESDDPKSGSWLGSPLCDVGWTTGDCVSGGVESNGRFELPAVQIMSQCFAEDAIPPPERVQLLRTLPQSGHEAGDPQISPACQMLLAVRAADRQPHLT